MKPLIILWKFARPHTIIGSIISITTLYSVIYKYQNNISFTNYTLAIIIGICTNIFIVGINQIADVNIDKINKPKLPIPAGLLTTKQATYIVLTALFISSTLALFVSFYLFIIIVLSTGIGWAYSMPPFHLKKHHFTAAFAITMVRAILLNAGGFLVFNYLENGIIEMPENVKILTLFIFLFSIVISWFKDLPDIKGDSKYHIKTLAIIYSPKATLIAGNLVVILAYIFTIYIKYIEFISLPTASITTNILLFGHFILLLLFIVNAFSINLNEQKSTRTFYKRFWWFFFAEYLIYLAAYLV